MLQDDVLFVIIHFASWKAAELSNYFQDIKNAISSLKPAHLEHHYRAFT
jgi:hypothetical protein